MLNKCKYSLLCFIFSFLTGITAIFIPLVNSLSLFGILLFLFFFFANCMIPILIGISFNTVDHKNRAASYGLNSLISTFFGNLPSPSIYGLINSKYKDKHKSLAMGFNCNTIWINTILVGVNWILRLREKKVDVNDIKNIEFEMKNMEMNDDDEILKKY